MQLNASILKKNKLSISVICLPDSAFHIQLNAVISRQTSFPSLAFLPDSAFYTLCSSRLWFLRTHAFHLCYLPPRLSLPHSMQLHATILKNTSFPSLGFASQTQPSAFHAARCYDPHLDLCDICFPLHKLSISVVCIPDSAFCVSTQPDDMILTWTSVSSAHL